MEFSSLRFVDIVVATPTGRVDHSSAEPLQHSLMPLATDGNAGVNALVLDFAGVEYVSSVGLRVVMMVAKQMRTRQARIAVAAMQPVVHEIFEITRFNHVVEVFPSVRAAVEQLSPAALAAYDAAQGAASR